jgi:hypothetical protein
MRLACCLFVLALASCTPSVAPEPVPNPPPSAPPAPVPPATGTAAVAESAACANLAALGCPEGSGACAQALLRVESLKGGFTQANESCISTAATPAAARACAPSFITCPGK